MKIQDLNPNPKNPRKISDAKLEMLKNSIETFGDLSGFIFNRALERLEGGHQRQKVIPADAEITVTKRFEQPTKTGTIALGHVRVGEEVFPYREVMWDEITSSAANIAANQHGGEWDFPLLTEAILEIEHANIDLELLGFDDAELEKLLTHVPGEEKSKQCKKCPKCGEEI